MSRVHIRLGGVKQVTFEVTGGRGELLARGVPLVSICRLEAALATLMAASREGWRIESDARGTTVLVGPHRRRVALDGPMTAGEVEAVIAAVQTATITDHRPPGRRRHDLTGHRCDLGQ